MAKKKKSGKKRLTKAEKAAKLPIDYIAKLKGEEGMRELRAYIQLMRSSYKRRVNSFRKNNLVSHAEIALIYNRADFGKIPLTKLNRNQLLYEFHTLAEFFNSETGSIEGIRRVNREQDIRIFGEDYIGRPLRQMSGEERTLYWRIYEEYKNQFPADVNLRYSSEFTQQTLAEIMFNPASENGEDFYSWNFLGALNSLKKELEERTLEGMADVPNQFSGRRDSFKW